MKNERAALSPAQESQLRAPTQRNRRASPHAKAFCGCATPLSPPLRTAVRQRPGPRTPSASDAALRVHKARSPHQTRYGSRYGQAGCLLHQGRPLGGWAVRLRSPPTTVPLRPMGGTGRSHRGLSRSRTASRSKALVTRAGQGHALVATVPLCSGGGREATGQHDMCDGLLYPRMPAGKTA